MSRTCISILLGICAVWSVMVAGCAAPPPSEAEARPGEDAAVDLEDVHERLEQLVKERRRASAANYQKALQLHGEGKGLEALSYAQQAVEDDSSNAEAQALLAEIRKALGRPETDMGGRFERIEVRRQLIQRDLTETFARGEKNLRAGEYTQAVKDFKEALRIIRAGRLILDVGDLKQRAGELLTEAEDKKRVQDIKRRKEQERQAREELDREIEAMNREKEQRLRKLWLDYEFHRSRHDYERARGTLEAIMAEDAKRKDAYLRNLEELDTERVRWMRRKYSEDLKYNIQMQMNDIDEGMIPYKEVFNYGDREDWRNRIVKRAEEMQEMYMTATVRTEKDIRVLRMVREAMVTDFETSKMVTRPERPTGEPDLIDIRNYLRMILPGIEFEIDRRLKDEGVAEQDVDLDLPGKSKLVSVLNHVCLQLGISWRVERGVVKFMLKDEAADMIIRRYDVSEIIFPIRDFRGEMVRLEDEENGVIELDTAEEYEGVNRINRFDMDQLRKLITLNTGCAEEWTDDPVEVGKPYIQEYNGEFLYIRQTEDVHDDINLLLERVRRLNSLLVSIETRFITVEKNFLQAIGVDFRDLGPIDPKQLLRQQGDNGPTTGGGIGRDFRIDIPGLSRITSGLFYSDSSNDIGVRTDNIVSVSLLKTNLSGAGGTSVQLQILDKISLEAILRAVRQDSNQHLLTAPRITCFNTQQASIYVGRQQTYIKSYRTGAGSVSLPELDMIADQTVLDVRPVVSADRRYITLFLRPFITFPPTFATARFRRGSDASGKPIYLEIQLPQQDSQDLRTVVVVPDGGTVLIGGLKEAEDKYRKREVPILAKIPLVGFFFRSEFDSTARRQLIVLVSAKIIAPDEMEAGL